MCARMRESTCKPKMNLCEDRREQSVKILRPELIPVLILMKTWSEGSGNPCENVDLVLLILEAVCALEGVQEEVSAIILAIPLHAVHFSGRIE